MALGGITSLSIRLLHYVSAYTNRLLIPLCPVSARLIALLSILFKG